MSYGSEDHVTTVLPSGHKKDNYEIDFEITVMDSLSAATTTLLKVKVKKLRYYENDHAYRPCPFVCILLFHHTSTVIVRNVQVRNAVARG